MHGRHFFIAVARVPGTLLVLVLLNGCGGQSPVSPTENSLMVSGHVYQHLTPESGEPPIAGVLITLRHAKGAESTSLTDGDGFYRIPATAGEVTVSVSKDGYQTRELRFDVTDDTVLNFSLTPLLPSSQE